MINILPLQEKKSIASAYRARRATLALFFIGTLACAGIVFLFPTILFLQEKTASLADSINAAIASTSGADEAPLRATITDINKKLGLFSGAEKPLVSDGLVAIVLADKPEGVLVNTLDITHKEKNNYDVSMHGIAPDRDTLLNYTKALEAKEGITNVEIPITNYLPESHLEFTITLTASL